MCCDNTSSNTFELPEGTMPVTIISSDHKISIPKGQNTKIPKIQNKIGNLLSQAAVESKQSYWTLIVALQVLLAIK